MKRYAALAFAAAAAAQRVGSETSETHPSLSWQRCTGAGSCSNVDGEVVIDANWRWLHPAGEYTNCYDGNDWVCTSVDECSECEIEGADYEPTYGATTSGDALKLSFITEHEYGTNIGSRFYLMESEDTYQMFKLMGNELAFDVELSTLDCGLNGALYFVAMEPDGGLGDGTNDAGAKYGTGYCDAQCARDLKYVGGTANVEGWSSSSNDDNAGVGSLGGCCAEIDVWESNAMAFALTPHPCEDNSYHVCEEDTCGGTYSDERFNGLCDANGCDYNPYRMGNPDFYGKGKEVDTNEVFTVVTRFENNKMSQFFVQNGQTIEIPGPKHEGLTQFENADLTPEFCTAVFEVFDDRNRFDEVGGWTMLNDALELEHVLVMSIWDDHYANMLWLDSSYPPEKAGTPGGDRGPCPQDSGVPADVEANFADATVTYSNIRFGPVGSTVTR